MWEVYILQTPKGYLYTGITNDLARRLKQHQSGKGAKYTRAFGAGKIVYREQCENRSAASKRECAIKALTRAAKFELIQRDH